MLPVCQEEEEDVSSEDEEIESSGDDEDGEDDEGAPMDADGQQVRAPARRTWHPVVTAAESIAAGLAPWSGCAG